MAPIKNSVPEIVPDGTYKSEDKASQLCEEIEGVLELSRQSPVGMCHKNLHKAMAEKYIEFGEETKGIFHLTESHGVSLRQRAMMARKLVSFIGITAHWIHLDTMERKSAALACRRIVGRHTYDKLAEAMSDVLKEYCIQNKVVKIVTDNGANFVKAFREFAVQPTDENNDEEDDDDIQAIMVADILTEGQANSDMTICLPPHQRCASHTLNLVATTDSLKALDADKAYKRINRSTFGKCQGIWNKQNQSSNASDCIKQKLGRYLVCPNATRWNSIYDSLMCISKMIEERSDDFNDACDKLHLPRISPNEVSFIKEYCSVMGNVANALDLLQGEKYMYMGYYTPTITRLKIKLEKCQTQRLQFCQPLATALINGINKRDGHAGEGINRKYLDFKSEYSTCPEGMLKRLEEVPKEWTIVQITCGFRVSDRFCKPNQNLPMPDLYITRFPPKVDGVIVDAPYCQKICYTLAQDESMVTPLEEIHLIVQENKIKPRTLYKDVKKYWQVRDVIAKRMENVIHEVEMSWIGQWRFLLLGRLVDSGLRKKINSFVDKFLNKNGLDAIPTRTRRILCRVVEASEVLKTQEMSKVLTELLGSKDFAKEMTFNFVGKFPTLKTAQRQTVILILDEVMEIVPWENMTVLNDHPVSRNECLPMLHALYKAHEESMESGFKVLKDPCGTFIVNADDNLPEMQERMENFLPKRLPSWVGTYGKKEQKSFKSGLTNYDIFLYSGHGNGRQIMGSLMVEQLRVRAVCMLMGCSSANFSSYGGRTELHGMSQSYHIGESPTILGNLWEVSDFDTDRITVALLHSWIPLDKSMSKLASAYLEDPKRNDSKYRHEPELLRALVIGRKAAIFSMTRFAFVARGLPVKIG